MAAKMTIQTRTQLPVYTAETLAAKNPVLLKGEIVYESDTGRHKLGDGTTAWNTLAYASDVEKVPALRWKVQGGMLSSNPRPTLRIRFLNAAASEYSTTRMHESESRALRSCARPAAGSNSCRTDFHATSCRGHRHASIRSRSSPTKRTRAAGFR